MDKTQENELVEFILQYMLDHYFRNKSDMARRLELSTRTVQRAFERLRDDTAKGSSIVLNRLLLYCAYQQLSMDDLFAAYAGTAISTDIAPAVCAKAQIPAYKLLSLPKPACLTEKGEMAYQYMMSFLQQASAYLCPRCAKWCNPWCHQQWRGQSCLMAHMADVMMNSLQTYHTRPSSSIASPNDPSHGSFPPT